MDPNLIWGPYEKGKSGHREKRTHTREEHRVEMEAEIGLTLRQAKEHQRSPASHPKPGEPHGMEPLTALRRSRPY